MDRRRSSLLNVSPSVTQGAHIVEMGTYDELMARNGVFAAMVTTQDTKGESKVRILVV